jgi:hypothetical protein
VVQVRKHRKFDQSQPGITSIGRSPANKIFPDVRCHYHTSRTHSHIDCLQGRQEICQSGMLHPVAKAEGVASRYQQDVRLPDKRHPAVFIDARQCLSSDTPTELQPRLTIGFPGLPLMNSQALTPGPTLGCPYIAVGIHRELESAMGCPSKSTSARCMLLLLTPEDVSRNFITSLLAAYFKGTCPPINYSVAAADTCHITPNLSLTCPYNGLQKVSWSGMSTCPPS